MTKAFSELRSCMTPEAQLRAQATTEQLLAEMPLNQLRHARELTQNMLAEKMDASSIAKLEKSADMYFSTLRTHIQGMGGDLEIIASFPTGSVRIGSFSD